jgi:hypothetical protein
MWFFGLRNNGNVAKVTHAGQLVTGNVAHDKSYFSEMSATGTAFNIVPPKVGFNFILSGLLAISDKNLTADAIIEVYEADDATSTTVLTTVFKTALTKNSSVTASPISIEVTEGMYLNAKTDDATIYLTALGYYTTVAP